MKTRDAYTASMLFAITVLSRMPFMSPKIFHCDSLGFAQGALVTWVAHPPGYIGYTTLGRIVNYILNDINLSFVLISIISTGLAAALLFLLGVALFGYVEGVLAALLYATSILVFYFSEVALTYAVEGFCATAFVLLIWYALKRQSYLFFLASTITLGLGGSVRQTTLAFLMPLWVYAAMKLSMSSKRKIGSLFLLLFIVLIWLVPSSYFMKKNGNAVQNYITAFYNLHIVTESSYNVANPYGGITSNQTPSKRRFLWPLIELVFGVWNRISSPLSSETSSQIINSSIKEALQRIGYQMMKVGLYIFLSCGLSCALLIAPILNKSLRQEFLSNKLRRALLGFWVLPSLFFFLFMHFGSWGYLLIFFGAFCLITARSLVFILRVYVSSKSHQHSLWFTLAALIMLPNIIFFVFAGPLPESSNFNKLLNITFFQYTAPAIQQTFARARSTASSDDPRQITLDCLTNKCLMEHFNTK